jgi:hypothetical protein
MTPAHPTLCEIACRPHDATNLSRAVKLCAEQIELSLDLVTSEQRPQDAPTITFHLGPDETAPGHQLLCFVCRLACLCPQARVGTVVHATSAFRRERLHCSA